VDNAEKAASSQAWKEKLHNQSNSNTLDDKRGVR